MGGTLHKLRVTQTVKGESGQTALERCAGASQTTRRNSLEDDVGTPPRPSTRGTWPRPCFTSSVLGPSEGPVGRRPDGRCGEQTAAYRNGPDGELWQFGLRRGFYKHDTLDTAQRSDSTSDAHTQAQRLLAGWERVTAGRFGGGRQDHKSVILYRDTGQHL